jgi:protein-S-isoprenylcysteine O-methyltransferase Ste14
MNLDSTRTWALAKTVLFTLVVPGTVGILIPHYLAARVPFLSQVSFAARLGSTSLLILGFALYLWCAWDFAIKGLGTPAPIDAPKKLVITGPYRYTRNPMYVGVFSAIQGQAIYYGSRDVAIYGCVMLAMAHSFVVFYEEPVLRRLFGEQYEQYCRKVPRWILPLPRSVAE